MEGAFGYSVLFTTLCASVIGALLVDALARQRDKRRQLREQRLLYLVQAYRTLSKVGRHPRLFYDLSNELEQSLADIQLLGTQRLITIAYQLYLDLGKNQGGAHEATLMALRNQMRVELGQPPAALPEKSA